jgi:hypothetical protein
LLSEKLHSIEHLFGARGCSVEPRLKTFILALELGDARREVDAVESALVFFDLFHTSFGEQRASSKICQLGRQIADERVELGEGALFSWFVVGH